MEFDNIVYLSQRRYMSSYRIQVIENEIELLNKIILIFEENNRDNFMRRNRSSFMEPIKKLIENFKNNLEEEKEKAITEHRQLLNMRIYT